MLTRKLHTWMAVFAAQGVWWGVSFASSAPLASTQLSAGNSRQTARYQLDDAVGGWGQRGDVASTAWVKPDFCGSLVDITSLEVTSPAGQLGEGQSVQLASRLRCDDESILANGFSTAWQIASGPLSSSGEGWVTGQPVYRNSNAVVQATSAGRVGQTTLLVLNTHLDNYGLYASDGIDDAWQTTYFGLENPLGLRGADPDQDGADNYYEFTSGTQPDLVSDAFELSILRQTNLVRLGLGPLATGRTYRVERATNIRSTEWSGVTNITANSPELVYFLSDTQSVDRINFYRVSIEYPWRATP